MARRSFAGVISRPALRQGSPAGMKRTLSSLSCWRAVSARIRWPMWIGSKVPPITPSLIVVGSAVPLDLDVPNPDSVARTGTGAPHCLLQTHTPQPLLQLVHGVVAAIRE